MAEIVLPDFKLLFAMGFQHDPVVHMRYSGGSVRCVAETENYFIEFSTYIGQDLVITFEAAGNPILRPEPFRPGWGQGFLIKNGISAISVKPKQVDWYRRSDLMVFLRGLESQNFFKNFGKVSTYGGSMGGYAALAFSGLVGANIVVALNPQTTLRHNLVPWETRFVGAQNYNWTGPLHDAANAMSKSAQTYVCFDPYFDLDRRHVDRLSSRNLVELHTPFLGHHVPAHLQELGALKPLLPAIMRGDFDINLFHKQLRARRDLRRYFNILSKHPRITNNERRASIVKIHKNQSRLRGIP